MPRRNSNARKVHKGPSGKNALKVAALDGLIVYRIPRRGGTDAAVRAKMMRELAEARRGLERSS